MSKKKIIVETAYTDFNEIYYIAHEDNMEIIGTGFSKKKAIENYEENKKIYEKLKKQR